MPNFEEYTDNIYKIVDPINGELITSTRVPQFLLTHERYGTGLNYFSQKAGSIAITLLLLKHVDAQDLGDNFEARLAEHNTIALEDNGWPEGTLKLMRSLSIEGSLSSMLQAATSAVSGPGQSNEYWIREVSDETTYYGRLCRAIEGSGIDVCIGDIPEGEAGEYEKQVQYMWRQAHKRDYMPLLAQAAIALREWFMVANLGVHLSECSREQARVLYPVGANHFLLQDKLMTLGIMPVVEMPSGDGGLGNPEDITKRLFTLRNVGYADMTGMDWFGRPSTE